MDYFPKLAGIFGRFLFVLKTFDHFSRQRYGSQMDSAWPSTKATFENRLLCRLMQTRGISGSWPKPLPLIRSPGVSESTGQTSTQPLSAKIGTLLDSAVGNDCHAARGPMP